MRMQNMRNQILTITKKVSLSYQVVFTLQDLYNYSLSLCCLYYLLYLTQEWVLYYHQYGLSYWGLSILITRKKKERFNHKLKKKYNKNNFREFNQSNDY